MLRLWGADPCHVETEVRPGPSVRLAIEAAKRARNEADDAAEKARQALTDAAFDLTGAGYSRRDIAILLGISHQRVQQLLDGS